MVKTLIDIAEGWYNAFGNNMPEDVRRMRNERLSKCENCPSKLTLSKISQKLVTTIANDPEAVYYCGECGCPLAGLTTAPDAKCKLGKWGPKQDDDYF